MGMPGYNQKNCNYWAGGKSPWGWIQPMRNEINMSRNRLTESTIRRVRNLTVRSVLLRSFIMVIMPAARLINTSARRISISILIIGLFVHKVTGLHHTLRVSDAY